MAVRAQDAVSRQFPYFGVVGLRARQINVTLADRTRRVTALATQARGRRGNHLLARHQHEGSEQQRKGRELAPPGRLT